MIVSGIADHFPRFFIKTIEQGKLELTSNWRNFGGKKYVPTRQRNLELTSNWKNFGGKKYVPARQRKLELTSNWKNFGGKKYVPTRQDTSTFNLIRLKRK